MKNRSAVILAAGKGTRLEPLTITTPKPLIRVAGKSILLHNMETLAPYVSEFVLVIGYMAGDILGEIGETFQGIPIKYVVQEHQSGTGDALHAAQEAISHDRFFMIYGDDIYDPEIIKAMSEEECGIVGKVSENWSQFGVLKVKEDGMLQGIIEKPSEFVGNLVNIGVYAFNKSIFNYFDNVPLSVRGEYELTDIVTRYCAENAMKVVPTEGYWLTVGYPWHILLANDVLLPKISKDIQGELEDYVTVKGNVVIGKGSVIKSGTYIEGNVIIGENCVIGPHSYIRGNVVIGNKCKIGSSVEIEHSSIGDKVHIEHLSFVGYSVLGNNIILGGGTITADRRHDRDPIRVNIKEQLIETHMPHLGAIIGDQVRTGINTSIYPGRKMHYHSYTAPGEIVKQDKLSSHDLELK